jgi:hypothetical protein
MTRVICAVRTLGAWGRTSCKRQVSGSILLTDSQVGRVLALLAPGSTNVGCITLTPSITSGSAQRTGRPKRLRCTGSRGQSGRSPRRPGRGRRLRWRARPAAEDMQVRTSDTNRVRQAARAGCRGTPARLGRYRSPGCSTSTCQPDGSDVSTRKTNLGYIRWTSKPAFGSTQVRKVRGPLTEYAGTLGVISPSHCSRSPHGAGEGASSARGLFRSW